MRMREAKTATTSDTCGDGMWGFMSYERRKEACKGLMTPFHLSLNRCFQLFKLVQLFISQLFDHDSRNLALTHIPA